MINSLGERICLFAARRNIGNTPVRTNHRLGVEFLESRALLASDVCLSTPHASSATAQPTPASEVSTDAAASRLDINGDGRVTALDALLLVNHANGASPPVSSAGADLRDVNADGKFSSEDIDVLVDYLNHSPDVSEPPLNAPSPFDIDGSGTVDQADALKLRNYLEDHKTTITKLDAADTRFDVNRDGYATNLDLLLVVNELNPRMRRS